MRGIAKMLALSLAIGGACMPAASAAEDAPTGIWETTNGCFLAALVLIDDGRAQIVYTSGQRDENAVWTWSDGILRIISRSFPAGRFTGHLTSGRLEAVWNQSELGNINRQACVFERYRPIGI